MPVIPAEGDVQYSQNSPIPIHSPILIACMLKKLVTVKQITHFFNICKITQKQWIEKKIIMFLLHLFSGNYKFYNS